MIFAIRLDPNAAWLKASTTSRTLRCRSCALRFRCRNRRNWRESGTLENRDGFRMAMFHVADDHVTADQLIESKHRSAAWSAGKCIPRSKIRWLVINEMEIRQRRIGVFQVAFSDRPSPVR